MIKTWLDRLYYDIGHQWTDYSVCHTWMNKGGEVCFSKWIPYMEAQEFEHNYRKVNQRTLLKNEIALEFDGEWQDYLKLIKSLTEARMEFYAYATAGHRAKHIHLFFGVEFASKTPIQRKQLRAAFIQKYKCDGMLSGDTEISRHMIALEHCPHWKTGQVKAELPKNLYSSAIYDDVSRKVGDEGK